ncbi:MAG TPA: hypothetical protein VNQ90_07935 [Chthoniobacteraceae bacterium]|nr:hypothetical protein [Chthoniobacteraceae bacterium]
MKRIAFVDCDIDNFHANTFARLLAEEGEEFTLSAVWAQRRDNLAAWAAARQVTAVETIAELAPLADDVMVLAPSNPETHLALCTEAFALGKTTYVDKTFAPDRPTAQRIFEAADAHGVAVQTSSVLRYTELQAYCQSRPDRPPRAISSWANGGNFNEYVIHPVESVISVMGPEVEAVSSEEVAGMTRITLRFSGDRLATIAMYAGHRTPFFHVVSDAEATAPIAIDGSRMFLNGLRATLDFFRAGKAQIPREETLAILGVLDAVRR